MAEIEHYFKCPSCGEEGMIMLPDMIQRFPCPTPECGAVFLHYQDLRKWKIQCVVQPVFQNLSSSSGADHG